MGLETGDRRGLRLLARHWWVVALVGALSVVAGVIVLAQPAISLATLAVVAGIFMLVDGIFEVAWALFDPGENRAVMAILGVVSAVVGVILIRHPTHAVVAIALLVGLWLLIAGVVRLIETLAQREGRLGSGLLAVLELVAGIVIVSSPGIGVKTLALLVGISFVARGIAALIGAWMWRGLRDTPPEDLPGPARPAI